MTYAAQHLKEASEIIEKLDLDAIEGMADLLATVKAEGGRIFFLGVGGSAGNTSHAVNDFRKIVGIESYAPTDNVSELTARTNDEGWPSIFVEWLKISKLNATCAKTGQDSTPPRKPATKATPANAGTTIAGPRRLRGRPNTRFMTSRINTSRETVASKIDSEETPEFTPSWIPPRGPTVTELPSLVGGWSA